MKIWTYLIKTTAFLKLLQINPLLAMVIFAETYFRRFTVAAHPVFILQQSASFESTDDVRTERTAVALSLTIDLSNFYLDHQLPFLHYPLNLFHPSYQMPDSLRLMKNVRPPLTPWQSTT